MKRLIGLIVNPVAGMGGAVGLKGTDGPDAYDAALKLGAKPVAPRRCEEFLAALKLSGLSFTVATYPNLMGEIECRNQSVPVEKLGSICEKTTSQDTKQAAVLLRERRVELLVFCGGDGTARDILTAIDGDLPTLGVPAGVKMYSAVFASTPRQAAFAVEGFLRGEITLGEAEVVDVDEAEVRRGRLTVGLTGYLMAPRDERLMTSTKSASPATLDEKSNQQAIAKQIVEHMEPDTLYILGPGTTVVAVAVLLGVKKTLLGVDVVSREGLIAEDVNLDTLLRLVADKPARIIISPLGRQGFLFGRGNQQIAAEVIERVGVENIIVVATKAKLAGVKHLRIDTGDVSLDQRLRGFMRVRTDYGEETMVEVI
ncbi:MAG: ATP-NAD kinase family protein [Candidatus Bathyarchaeia archaeon]